MLQEKRQIAETGGGGVLHALTIPALNYELVQSTLRTQTHAAETPDHFKVEIERGKRSQRQRRTWGREERAADRDAQGERREGTGAAQAPKT